MNIASGVVYGYTLVLFYRIIYIGDGADAIGTGLKWSKIFATFWVRICQVASGVILVRGILRIRRFFREQDAEDYINTAMLLRHGIAFSLYLFGTSLTAISLVFFNIWPDDKQVKRVFFTLFTLDFVFEFVSQLLLV